ncbi:uncharacterized protein LOC119675792 [Teleopsis dalmanni]|uniref:uncharacterized protein LOC119675792 n=1 Tax=Teleopsis dalmanni TaxID=139649 RepID=UPI0018CFD19A|nr:uncharacterized protein LOC119675792 [Teleopsis dalmanni]
MHEPALLRSCCKIPYTDEYIKQCRKNLLNTTLTPPTLIAKIRQNKVALHICIAECEFNAKRYLSSPNKANMTAIEVDLKTRHRKDLEYVNLLLKGLWKCLEYANLQYVEHSWLFPSFECNSYPAALLACATETVYENCPTNRWRNSTKCEAMREFLVTCDEEIKSDKTIHQLQN